MATIYTSAPTTPEDALATFFEFVSEIAETIQAHKRSWGFSVECSICGTWLSAHNTDPVSDIQTAYCIECAEKRFWQAELAGFCEAVGRIAEKIATVRKARAAKTVQVVARITFKDPARADYVVYAVRSSNGVDLYHTTLVNGHATGCTCPARKPCYHMTQLEAYEIAFVAEMAEAKARMANAQEQVAEATVLVEAVMPEMVDDLSAHVEDELRAEEHYSPVVAAPKAAKFVNKTARQAPMTQAEEMARAEEERQKRLLAPLNGNGSFSLLMPERPPRKARSNAEQVACRAYHTPVAPRQQETW